MPARFERPQKLLKGFQRVELKAGASKEIRISVKKKELEFYDPVIRGWVLDNAYRFYVGNSSQKAMEQYVDLSL